jgi:hypothetical protein
MKKVLAVLFALSLASTVLAQEGPRHTVKPATDDDGIGATTLKKFPINPAGDGSIQAMVDENDENLPVVTNLRFAVAPEALRPAPLAVNLTYHGGDVINTAKVVCIFWGPTWASGGSDSGNAANIQSFRNQLGTSSHYSMLTQYYDSAYINTSNLLSSQADWFDTTNPLPSTGNVTDSIVRQEVGRYIAAHGVASSTIYEVFLPKYVPGTTKLVYSSDGSSTSCGGPGLAYCAYHSSYLSGSTYVKYSIEPYPSCSGCQVSGWTTLQNMTHFMVHETREAVTDPRGNAWYDSSGYEADDKCAWTGLFTSGGFGYQPEWSNAAGGCVQ